MPRVRRVLADLLKIYMKYDEDEIDAALNLLQSGEAFRDFAELSRKTSKLPKSGPESGSRQTAAPLRKSPVRSKRAQLDEFIASLFASGNDQFKEIGAALMAASKKEILSSTSMLEKLFISIGLPAPEHEDRFSMIQSLGEHLIKLSPDEIRSILQLVMDRGNEESSLQRWTDIIVQKGRPGRQ